MTRGRYRWALAVVAVSAFMTTMDNTVVFAALPTIMTDLDMSSSAKDWVATGYILMFSCLMITGGRLTDVFGCRLTFTTGMVVFTAASAVCGLAQSSDVLILARIVQGGGAALVLPATQVMVTVGRNDKQRSIGNIAFIGAASSATALGPTIGGVIVQHWHWGWIFLINIVPGILVTVLGLFVLTSKGENKHARVDLPGVLISATMLFAFIYGLESGNRYGWSDPSVLSVFALGAIALACFVLVESWAPDPMIDMRFFRNRVFTGGLMSQMLYGIGFNGMMFYAQPFLQRFLGFSPPEAGLVMLPPAIAIMVLTPVAFLLAAKIGPRPAIGAGMALMGLGMFLFSTLRTGDGYAELMPGVMLVGVGAALGMPLVMYVLKAVPERRAGVASGVINVIREASGAFGIAIVGLLVHNVPDEGASAAELETFRDGTSSGLILGAGLVLIGGMISAVTLPSRRGWLGPKHGKKPPIIPDREPEPAPDLVPAGSGGLAVTAASPPSAPVPLPSARDDDAPHPAPVPGPHWWADAEPKPAEDAFTWSKEVAPWPPPPTAPAATWEDWPAETTPGASASELRSQSAEGPEDPLLTPRPGHTRSDEDGSLSGDTEILPAQSLDDPAAPVPGNTWFAAEPSATGTADDTALPAHPLPAPHADTPPSTGAEGHHTATETSAEPWSGDPLTTPPAGPRWSAADPGQAQHDLAAPAAVPGPPPRRKRWWEEDEETLSDGAETPATGPTTWQTTRLDEDDAWSDQGGEGPGGDDQPEEGQESRHEGVTTGHRDRHEGVGTGRGGPGGVSGGVGDGASPWVDDREGQAGGGSAEVDEPGTGVRGRVWRVVGGAETGDAGEDRRVTGDGGDREAGDAGSQGVETAGDAAGAGRPGTRTAGGTVAGGTGAGAAGARGAWEGEVRPAPPEGWYEPYVPEDEPVDEPRREPRSDAW